jgi:hemoglobin
MSMNDPMTLHTPQQTLYEQIGGDLTFRQLVDAFYRRIEADPILRPLFPNKLDEGKEHQFLFLTQYWGGPARYTDLRGHPRLRKRHFPFAISQIERDTWVGHMIAAIDETDISEPARSQLIAYFEQAGTAMINT